MATRSAHPPCLPGAREKVALDLAGRSGIRVPRSRLLQLAGRSVLIVDRFDRSASGGRIGYASAMTMLEATDGQQRSYLEIAEVVESSSDRATADLRELWRRMVFTVLVSNTDDHLRNHGFLHERDDVWRLSPAFDVNPDPRPGPSYLSTSIEGADDIASLRAAMAVADAFRLSRDHALGVLAEVATAVAQWRRVASAHGMSEAQIEEMSPAFSALGDVDLV